ncbi:MAG: hypothetical protein PVSMB8_10660 [Vulcanimicrobiaceae bacterium]
MKCVNFTALPSDALTMKRHSPRPPDVIAIVTLGLLLGSALPAKASRLPDPCRFLRPEQAARVTGLPLVSSRFAGDDNNGTCIFSQASDASPLPIVTIDVNRLHPTGLLSFRRNVADVARLEHSKARPVAVPGHVAVGENSTVLIDLGTYMVIVNYTGSGSVTRDRAMAEALSRAARF